MVPEKLSKARYLLTKSMPYLASVLYSLKLVETDKVPVAAVDMYGRLYYNPSLEKFSVEQIAGVIEHEIWHYLREHFARLKSFQVAVANIAADFEINDSITFELPDGALFPDEFGLPEHLLAEEYASRILQNTEKFKNLIEAVNKIVQPGAGRSGSAATGMQEEWELGPDVARHNGQDVKPIDDFQRELIKRKVAEDIVNHAKSRGSVPDDILRWAEAIIEHRVPWNKILAKYLRYAVNTIAGKADYSFAKPNRRSPEPFIFPGLVAPKLNVAIVVDTSGSISDEELSMFLAEIKGILKAVVSEVTVLSCDSVVHEKAKINRITQLKDKLVGGGGTNMAVGIQEALKEGDIVVVFTDGETPWPEEPVKKPVIAVLTQDNKVPGWIKKVVMD